MKKLLSLIVMLMLLGIITPVSTLVHASDDDDNSSTSVENTDSDDYDDDDYDDDEDEDDEDEYEYEEEYENGRYKSKMKVKMDGVRMELKEDHDEMKEGIRMNREEAKMNREDFRMEYHDDIEDARAALTDEQKEELADLREDFEAAMDALKDELKDAETDEEKDAILAEIKALAEENMAAMKEILGDNADALAVVEARKDVWKTNEELRQDSREMRRDYKEVRRSTVEKYREAFVARLGDKLDSIPADKLEQILERIDTLIEKYENNETISDTKKEAMLSALMALKEIVEEKMEGDETTQEVLDAIDDLIE